MYTPGNAPGDGGPVAVKDLATVQTHVGAIADGLGTRDVLGLDAANVGLIRHTLLRNYFAGGTIYVATPALLEHYRIAPKHDPERNPPHHVPSRARRTLRAAHRVWELPVPKRHRQQPSPNPGIQEISQLPTEVDDPNLLVTSYAVRDAQAAGHTGGLADRGARLADAVADRNRPASSRQRRADDRNEERRPLFVHGAKRCNSSGHPHRPRRTRHDGRTRPCRDGRGPEDSHRHRCEQDGSVALSRARRRERLDCSGRFSAQPWRTWPPSPFSGPTCSC